MNGYWNWRRQVTRNTEVTLGFHTLWVKGVRHALPTFDLGIASSSGDGASMLSIRLFIVEIYLVLEGEQWGYGPSEGE